MKNIEDFYPLSPMQQGILFHTLYAPNTTVYCEQISCTFQGEFNISAFQKAWQKGLERHQVLRTSFIWEGLKEPAQVVHKQVKLPWKQYDWCGLTSVEQQERLEAFLKADKDEGFELSQAPLMRLTLIGLTENRYQFIWSRHHLLLDGWSSSILLNEVFAFYKAFSQGENLYLKTPRPYRDYIAWLQQQNSSESQAFWRQRLQNFTAVTSLGVDQTSNSVLGEDNDYKQQQLRLSTAQTAALQSFAKQQQLTLSTIVQGAWAILLSRYSGEKDIVFGNVMSGRGVLGGDESIVGVLINTVPQRIYTNAEEYLLPWLKQLQIQQNEILQYQHCPLIEIQKWSDMPAGQPLFESILNFQNYPINFSTEKQVGNLKISDIRNFRHPHYPLNISFEVDQELSVEIFYNSRRFKFDTITRMLGHLQMLFSGIVANPEQRLGDLPILTAKEHHQLLVEWNKTEAEYPQHHCIHQLFEAQVEQTPDAVAVVFENQQLTYRELNCRANQLAHYLRSLGVKPEVLVGICVERSIEMIVGLLGILKAGAAYVPIDPAYPQERLAFMLEDSQLSVLLTKQKLAVVLPHKAEVVCLDADWEKINKQSADNLINKASAENLAYVIYTSGSTGQPKGVQISHGAVVNFLSTMRQTPGLTKEDIFLSVTTLSFDIAALELYLPLIVGACLVIVSREVATDGIQLLNRLAFSKATVMQGTPATWRLLLNADWGGSKQLKILCGGEALDRSLANQLLERSKEVWNLYGPTETTIWSAVQMVENTNKLEQINSQINSIVSIGRPIANTQFYILDQHQHLVPVGVPGELHIGGTGLARGYLNRPELTAEKFISNPFHKKPGERLYKTGDLARYREDGSIDFLGRIDNQVKLRGFRIELGEIEALLNEHPSVQTSVVVVREENPNFQNLVAYVVKQAESAVTINELRHFLESKLPSYMMPSSFVTLEKLPLTPNGKVDRRGLPAPDLTQLQTENSFVHPSKPVEEMLAGIWADVLGIEIGIYDNFFELGGHSLIATRLMSKVREVFGVELPLRCLFESPTVASFAKRIENAQRTDLGWQIPPLLPVPRNGELELSFAQRRLWFLAQLEGASSTYNEPAILQLNGVLHVAALEQSFTEIVRRHEVLRTNFPMVNGKPVQAIASSVSITLPILDLSSLQPEEQSVKVQQLILEEVQRPFDLAKELLLRVSLFQLGEKSHVLLLVMHHIVSDGWSTGIFIRELSALYKAFAKGEPSPLPELSIQYADFAYWQHQWLQGEVMEKHLSYWKKQLANLPVVELPTDHPRPEFQTFRGTRQYLQLPKELSEEIAVLNRREGVTLFMTLVAAFKTLLHYYAKQDDIIVGTDIANRNCADTEELIGFFVNQLVLRTDLSGDPTFQELLGRVREITLAAYNYQDMPFDQLVLALNPERELNRTPLFQSKFVLQNAPMPPLELEGLTFSILEVDSGKTKFDLLLSIWETEQGLRGKMEYSTDLFNASTIAQMLADYETILRIIVAQPNIKLTRLKEFLVAAEKQRKASKIEEFKQARRQKFKTFKTQAKPTAINLSEQELVEISFLEVGGNLPLIAPKLRNLNLPIWAENNREFIEKNLFKYGGILFRGFAVNEQDDFERFVSAVCPQLMPYIESSTPRTKLSEKVYTSTEFPADQTIALHNESSYANTFPMKIWFCCIQPANQGGETPIADVRKVFQRIHPKIRERFQEKGWMLVRNFGDGFGLPWQTAFHTTDKTVLEEYCRNARIEFEWKDSNRLRTRSCRPAVARHPKIGEMVWFNHVVFWHVSSLQPQFREKFLSEFTEEDLPYNTYYGDGSPIESSIIEEIRQAYQQETIVFPWQKGDILMLDNMLTAHGRNPYSGTRKILTAMGEPFRHNY